MSRSNYDKPFYVDVGTSIVAVRCASNRDVVLEYDHSRHPFVIELAEKACDRMNKEAEIGKPRRNCDVGQTQAAIGELALKAKNASRENSVKIGHWKVIGELDHLDSDVTKTVIMIALLFDEIASLRKEVAKLRKQLKPNADTRSATAQKVGAR